MQNFYTTANLSYDQKCSPFRDHANISHDLHSWALYKDQAMYTIHKLHPLYTFLVADYWSSTVILSYKPLWQFGEATLQHIPHIHSAFYGNSAALEYQPMSPKGFLWCP